MSKDGTKSAVLKSVLLLVFGGLVILGLFSILTRRPGKKASDDYVLTNIDKITTTNLDTNYPADPRKVVELYGDIMKVLYNEDCTEEQEQQIIAVLSGILDEELLNNQSNLYKSMTNEVKSRKDEGYSFSTYQVLKNEPDIVTVEGRKMCDIECYFSLMHGKTRENYYYTFYMRRDSDNKWKILGWTAKDGQ
ncbi:DUF6715 family protein [Butyrivibrio proteoclasticus]|uniref:DUF6715 family protein n=1 Tax=Butyrivibrio proteoclasticus TaxID=43305 RepID=UPI00047C0D5A|nr:DUF6715 family protein [Butyrivibrio proteoclasticus]